MLWQKNYLPGQWLLFCRKLFESDRHKLAKSAILLCYALGDFTTVYKQSNFAAVRERTKYNLKNFNEVSIYGKTVAKKRTSDWKCK